MPDPLALFAVCPPGLEPILAGEIEALGLRGAPVPGGVEVRGTLETAARLNLYLRTASRVLVRLGEVRATRFPELVHKASSVPFELCLGKGARVAWRVTCRKSRLYHSDAVAERLHAAAEARLRGPLARGEPEAEEAAGEVGDPGKVQPAAQLILARFDRDVCTLSADTSGALLHLRGYRTAVGRAPLRETLAAALLLAAGYTGAAPLLDPFCGAGTLPIEAALLARRRAPGLTRSFAFEQWPGFAQARWDALRAAARAAELPRAPALLAGSDLDPAAIHAARSNAQRAGVEADIGWCVRDLADLPALPGPGLLVTNPPYGVRLGATGEVGALYRSLGSLARSRLGGWQVALIADGALARGAALPWTRLAQTRNGGLPVELLRAQV